MGGYIATASVLSIICWLISFLGLIGWSIDWLDQYIHMLPISIVLGIITSPIIPLYLAIEWIVSGFPEEHLTMFVILLASWLLLFIAIVLARIDHVIENKRIYVYDPRCKKTRNSKKLNSLIDYNHFQFYKHESKFFTSQETFRDFIYSFQSEKICLLIEPLSEMEIMQCVDFLQTENLSECKLEYLGVFENTNSTKKLLLRSFEKFAGQEFWAFGSFKTKNLEDLLKIETSETNLFVINKLNNEQYFETLLHYYGDASQWWFLSREKERFDEYLEIVKEYEIIKVAKPE